MVKRFHRFVGSYLRVVAGREKFALLVILVTFLASAYAAFGLKLKSDLKELLPQNYPGVQELDRVLKTVGGVGSLVVVAESPDPEANKRFMDALAKRLGEEPEGLIRYISYKADDVRKFYENHFLYYIGVSDLELMYNRLKKRVDFEKIKRSPLYIDLAEEGDVTPPELNFDDIRERNEKNYSAPVTTVDDYYGGEWGRMLIMVIRPYGATITIESARRLVGEVERVVSELDPASFDPRLKVGTCGNVKSTIEEYDTLKRDILSTALLCLSLVAAAIIVYFLRVRVVFLLGASLLIALAWTFAATRFAIGYLNAQTAFLGSIIVGTGINYGIILTARYLEERKKQRPPLESMQKAMEATARPTLLAAATTAVAFAVLTIARIRGLSQFGFIGATGVMFCWVSAMFVLPVLTLESEKILKLVKPRLVPKRESALFAVASRVAMRMPAVLLVLASLAAIAAAGVVWRFAPHAIEYDFTKMRNQVSVASGTEALEKRVSKLFKHSMTPSAVLVGSVEEGMEVCDAVMRQNDSLPVSEQRVGSCHSIDNLLPPDQERKLPIMEKLRALLSERWVRDIKGDARRKVDRVRRSILGRALTVEDLPAALTSHFEDLEGRRGAVVFINPRPGMLLSDGRNLMRFADTIRDIRLPDGSVKHAASESIIFSDLIEIIKHDAPYLTLASLLCVVVFIVIALKRVQISAVVVCGLVWAVLVMVGIAALLEIKINFFNFIVLPLTFGIGVDYGINVAMRIHEEGPMSAIYAIRHTGGAVVLCSATTIIGYFVLTTAANQALATFGLAAVIGEIACITSAILLVPAIIVFSHKFREGRRS
ncbi:MAG TPA: MMPL family transporter [bacterium]|nr:MMPL family transporter [bacterium]